MVKALIGKKIGMTQVFDESGKHVPVTVLQVGPCVVTQVKTEETDNVAAVQVGFMERKRKNTTQPLLGHFEKADATPKQVVHDVAPEGDELPEPGQELGADIFEETDYVDVTGTSKGRGFAGVVRRHGFATAPKTHGGRFGRTGGAIGTSATPARVIKGVKMPGQMGNEQVTIRNLQVVKVDAERNLVLVKGSVAGPKGGFVMVRKAIRPPR
jgi:large subunit ribosomal protein L3